MENCTKFGQLILSKIIKIVATSCQISRLKSTKFDFGCAPPDPLAGLRGPTSKGGREGERKKGRGEGCPGFDFEIYGHLTFLLFLSLTDCAIVQSTHKMETVVWSLAALTGGLITQVDLLGTTVSGHLNMNWANFYNGCAKMAPL